MYFFHSPLFAVLSLMSLLWYFILIFLYSFFLRYFFLFSSFFSILYILIAVHDFLWTFCAVYLHSFFLLFCVVFLLLPFLFVYFHIFTFLLHFSMFFITVLLIFFLCLCMFFCFLFLSLKDYLYNNWRIYKNMQKSVKIMLIDFFIDFSRIKASCWLHTGKRAMCQATYRLFLNNYI